ncbi:MAG: CoA ester lyase [Lacisediminimonas sp.]|nr:CoA ester lyase [Lacisediminimonas sp.]
MLARAAMTAPQRSWLFVPGNRPERFGKALAAGAHAVIIDLEDAVAPADKHSARSSVKAWLSPAHAVYLRVNAPGSIWFQDDLALCALPGVAGIVLPKAERSSDIGALVGAGARQVLPLIESAQGLWNAEQLARQPQVLRLMFGNLDFSADMGIGGDQDELLAFRSQLVLVSRVACIQAPIDGVSTELDDAQAVARDTARARRLGFGGKLCIHPRQVPHVNAGFMPDVQQIAWARKVVAAASESGGAAVAVDGRMVDRPVIAMAQEILAESAGSTQQGPK